jgi:hypothetical protein
VSGRCSSAPLMARLVKAEKYQISLRPGRWGWSLTSPLTLHQVRWGLEPWAARVIALHEPSGRYLVQPSKSYFTRVLRPVRYCRAFHGCPVRAERMRRLRPFLTRVGNSPQPRGTEFFLALALRIEAMGMKGESAALWRHLSHDFDKLWTDVPLFGLGLEPWQRLVLNLLCHPVSASLDLGKVTYKE